MTGLSFTPTPDNRMLRETGHDQLPATLGEVLGATIGDPTSRPTEMISRQSELSGERGFTFEDPDTRRMMESGLPRRDPEPTESAEKLNDEFGYLGLSFDKPTPRRVAETLAEWKREERIRQDIIRRGPHGIGTTALKFGAGFVGAAIDPLNIAASFVPIVREARYAAMLARVGKNTARLSRGVIEGVVGNAMVEPVVAGLAREQQLDYTMADALLNVTLGGLLGGGLHVGAGRVGDFLAARRPETREAALRTAVAQSADGRTVDVNSAVRTSESTADPFDPNELFRDASRQIPEAPPFRLGEPTGKGTQARYQDYQGLSLADNRWIEGVAADLDATTSGQRFFRETEGQGSTPDVIGVKADTPEWFQQANKEIRKEQKRLTKLRRTATDKERKALPSTPAILTRKKVREVARKLVNREPLGAAEGRVAEHIVDEARANRAANVRDMIAFRESRAVEREDEISRIAEREASFERDASADFEAANRAQDLTARAPEDFDDAAALAEADFIAEQIEEMRRAGALTDVEQKAVDEIAGQVEHAEAYARGAKEAALCLARNG